MRPLGRADASAPVFVPGAAWALAGTVDMSTLVTVIARPVQSVRTVRAMGRRTETFIGVTTREVEGRVLDQRLEKIMFAAARRVNTARSSLAQTSARRVEAGRGQ
ncbi:hypothetical protein GCM10009780_02990 [Actinomadura alba]